MHSRLCSLIAALLVSLALPGVSRAQAPGGTPLLPAEQPMLQDEKSPLLALGLPILATGLGMFMLGSGNEQAMIAGSVLTLAGPSAGHFYAGESRTAMRHIGLRTAAVAVSTAGFVGMFFFMDCGLLEENENCDLVAIPALLMIGGSVVGAGSAIYSVVDAPAAANRHNRKARTRQLFITPAPMVGPDHATGLGLQLGGRF